MKKKLKKMIDLSKKNKYYLIMFAFVLIISLLVPLSGDDWANYYPDITISKSISIAFKFYSTFESRIASRFLINLLCYHKVVWAIINALSLIPNFCVITFRCC